ncbi:MAG: hypothetical protein AB7U38_09020 [Hyphomicrobiales bacterium]
MPGPRSITTACSAICAALFAASLPTSHAQACCDPESPFREGEGWSDRPATCETVAGWAEKAPGTSARISMTIRGRLAVVEKDSALVYLVMCEEPGMQVLCVTYERNGMTLGEVVEFGGGYERRGPRQIVLDPCLASRE